MLTGLWLFIAAANVAGIVVNVRTYRAGYFRFWPVALAIMQGLLAGAAIGGVLAFNGIWW